MFSISPTSSSSTTIHQSDLILVMVVILCLTTILVGYILRTSHGEHPIYATVNITNDTVRITYEGGRDITFVDSITIYFDCVLVDTIKNPIVGKTYTYHAVNVTDVIVNGVEIQTNISRKIAGPLRKCD